MKPPLSPHTEFQRVAVRIPDSYRALKRYRIGIVDRPLVRDFVFIELLDHLVHHFITQRKSDAWHSAGAFDFRQRFLGKAQLEAMTADFDERHDRKAALVKSLGIEILNVQGLCAEKRVVELMRSGNILDDKTAMIKRSDLRHNSPLLKFIAL